MKRRIIVILLLLAGGAIVNVAVAWVLAWSVVSGDLQEISSAGIATAFDDDGLVTESWLVDCFNGFGVTMLASGRFHFPPFPATEFDGLEHPLDVLPRWVEFDPPSAAFRAGQAEGDSRAVILTGWPRRALGCVFDVFEGRPTMAFDTGYRGASGMPRLLPLRPVLGGFIINSLFYAMLLWMLFFAPFAARRTLRRRRGLCAKCAYPIGVSRVCTECGAAVARRATT